MKTYMVLYRDDTLRPLDPPHGFRCEADDGDHAEEQCLNAYPNCEVVWLLEGDNHEDALSDYWNSGMEAT